MRYGLPGRCVNCLFSLPSGKGSCDSISTFAITWCSSLAVSAVTPCRNTGFIVICHCVVICKNPFSNSHRSRRGGSGDVWGGDPCGRPVVHPSLIIPTLLKTTLPAPHPRYLPAQPLLLPRSSDIFHFLRPPSPLPL